MSAAKGFVTQSPLGSHARGEGRPAPACKYESPLISVWIAIFTVAVVDFILWNFKRMADLIQVRSYSLQPTPAVSKTMPATEAPHYEGSNSASTHSLKQEPRTGGTRGS